MADDRVSANPGIKVIARAADILRLLRTETGGLSLGQIALQVNLPRSTVQRIVSALAAEGFISTRKGSGGIRLGPEIQSLAQAASSGMKDRLRPIMKKISVTTGETVDLAVVEGGRMLFIDQIVGSQRLRAVSSIGETFPMTTTANGKAALACMEKDEAADLAAAEFSALGGTAKPFAEFLAEIDEIRRGELARDENEHTEGICALGFAVRDPGGDVFALSTPVPSSRYLRIKNDLSKTMLESRAETLRLAEPIQARAP